MVRCGAGLLSALVLACACAGDGAEAPVELTVFAASSLIEAFEGMRSAFAEHHPDTDVTFNFAGSQRLAAQIAQGAPADVFASASGAQMDAVVEAGLAEGQPRPFAGNRLQIAVEPGNPKGIATLRDLAAADVKLVLGALQVPAGRYAAEALEAAGVDVEPVSLETDVRQVLSKVALGEADAGIVYVTDVTGAGAQVEGVPIPAEDNVPVTYPIVALAEAPNPGMAADWVDFVLSDRGQSILADHGFSEPWVP
ncbi:MAG: molybdate ABC transporter substrate-binding protein [Euzebyales bacterium]|nr:molybdate ABC transporter substrate-binding protein [Euzebyales bacterium]